MRNRPLCSICVLLSVLICLCVCLGGEHFVKDLSPSQTELYLQNDDTILLTGRVYDRAEKENYQILYLKENSIIYQKQSLKESKLIIYEEEKQNIEIGEVVTVTGKIQFFEPARNPGNFDQKLYYQRQGIHASVWATTVLKNTTQRTSYEKLKECLLQFRERLKQRLCDSVGEKTAGILAAMFLGEKTMMDQEVKELYQVMGIGHILAISGLHLSILGVRTYRGIRRISGSYLIGGIFGSLFLTLYVVMVGVRVSVVRAFVMLLFQIGADVTGRSYDSVTALSFAALLVLLWRPLLIFDGGFWMSFGAVAAMIFILPAFRNLPFQSFWASISIQLLLLPVLLTSFYEFPMYSILLNMIVLPLMTLLFLLVFSGILAGSAFLPAGDWLFKTAAMILTVYEKLCKGALFIPGARIVTGKPKGWQVAVYYGCLLGALVFYGYRNRNKKKRHENACRKRGKNRWIPVWIWVVGFAFLVFPFGKYGKVTVTMLDVGQGDSTFVQGPYGKTYLIDGGSSSVKHVGQYRIEPFLKSQGVKKLDYVFVSHGDSDHIGGIEEMLQRQDVGIQIDTLVFPTKTVWDENLINLARIAMENKTRCVTLLPGKSVKEGDLVCTCLLPEEDNVQESSNASSMVLSLSYQEFDLLLTGDIEGGGEEKLEKIIETKGQQYEVLKVSHHGSRQSSTDTFLKAADPEIAVISVGEKNRYGHPHKETLQRLSKIAKEVYCTKESGAVTITVKRRREVSSYSVIETLQLQK